MKLSSLILSAAASLALVQGTMAQTTPTPLADEYGPTISAGTTGTALLPSPNVLYNTESIGIAGTAADIVSVTGTGTTTTTVTASGIARVEYKISGGSWKKLMMLTPGAPATNFFGSFKLGKGKSTRFSIRAFDRAGNEGTTTTFIVKRSRVTRKYQDG